MWYVRGGREVYKGVWWGNLKERDHLEDLGVDGRMILKRILIAMGRRVLGMNQDRDKWEAVVNTVMNFRFP
jgi:hypothetical protein